MACTTGPTIINLRQQSASPNHSTLTTYIAEHFPTFIVVEIGSTHCASLETAKRLIDVIKIAGADCVKLQKRDVESLLTRAGREKPYTSAHAMAPTYGEHRKIMEFSNDDFRVLRDYATAQGLYFSASAWDPVSVDFLDELGVPFYKVASADLTNLPLLEHIAKKGRPVFLSTGMGDMEDVERAYNLIRKHNANIVLFQCTSSYPTPRQDVHLNVLHTFKKKFPDVILGFSGHEPGTVAPVVAVAMGARVIEKHLTLNKEARGTDHSAALNPMELGEMVHGIRFIEAAMGSYEKKIQDSERGCMPKLLKSVTSTKSIPKGTIITREMLTTKSPGTGISPVYIDDLVGQKVLQDIEDDVTVTWEMFPKQDEEKQ